MCGICGMVLADATRSVSGDRIEAMANVIAHRGPDERGAFVSGRVGLGHRRLSIIDLAHGQQPMANEDGNVRIVFNGEIYNFADYHAGLRSRGHVLRTRSDTEVLVHLAEESEIGYLADLRGMFAFAVWDERRQSLLLARDHTGIKPMYYAQTRSGDIVFGSEIKAILASRMIPAELDEDVVAEYFAFGHVSGERTLYRGVHKLAPGHALLWRDGRTAIKRFWRVGAGATDVQPLDRAAAGAAFWPRFVDAVRSQLVADVPLGVFLSGGLDSSLIVAAMRATGVEKLQSFSVGFAEASASELPFARIASRAFATEHHEVTVGADEFFDAVPKLSWHRDAPLTFSASIPLYFVSRLAREHVKVVLTGEGSDELFAGYGRYPRALWNRRIAALLDRLMPRAARSALANAINALGDGYASTRLRRSALARRRALEHSYLEAFADFDDRSRAALLASPSSDDAFGDLKTLIDQDLLRRNPLEAMLRLDQATYLEELLMKQDQMSMATSIESRVPFLDHLLVDWAATLPASTKLAGFTGKALVRDAAARHLPRSIAHGSKRGFTLPLTEWLRGRGRDWLRRYAPAQGDGLLDHRYVARLIHEHVGGLDHTGKLWRVLAFQIWRRDVLAPAHTEFHSRAATPPAAPIRLELTRAGA
jgi:asparagine synthase (glutamine-hydrolysing)